MGMGKFAQNVKWANMQIFGGFIVIFCFNCPDTKTTFYSQTTTSWEEIVRQYDSPPSPPDDCIRNQGYSRIYYNQSLLSMPWWKNIICRQLFPWRLCMWAGQFELASSSICFTCPPGHTSVRGSVGIGRCFRISGTYQPANNRNADCVCPVKLRSIKSSELTILNYAFPALATKYQHCLDDEMPLLLPLLENFSSSLYDDAQWLYVICCVCCLLSSRGQDPIGGECTSAQGTRAISQ